MKFLKTEIWKIRIFFVLAAIFFSLSAQNANADCAREKYKVKRGDTISTILHKKMNEESLKSSRTLTLYGPKGLINRTLKINHKKLSNPDLIFPGETIFLPEEITPNFAASQGCPKASLARAGSDSTPTTNTASDSPTAETPPKDTTPSEPAATSQNANQTSDPTPATAAAPAAVPATPVTPETSQESTTTQPSPDTQAQVQTPAPASLPPPAPPAPETPPEPVSDPSLAPKEPTPDTGTAPPIPAASE